MNTLKRRGHTVSAINKYDGMDDVNPAEWMALDEDERVRLVMEFHQAIGVDLPDVKMHAMLHVIIENQIALGDETPVADKLNQLRGEGLDRHEAIHALASVLINHLYEGWHGSEGTRSNDNYYADLETLTAENWLQSGYEDSTDDETHGK